MGETPDREPRERGGSAAAAMLIRWALTAAIFAAGCFGFLWMAFPVFRSPKTWELVWGWGVVIAWGFISHLLGRAVARRIAGDG